MKKTLLSLILNLFIVSSIACESLHDAASSGNLEQVEIILKTCTDVNATNSEGWIPPHGWTPLHLAVNNGHIEVVRTLLKVPGINVSAANKFRWDETPLHGAAEKGYIEITKLLINAGANINAEKNGETPLHTAARNHHTEIVKLLIAAGADVKVPNTVLGTPLHNAVFSGDFKSVLALIYAGSDVNSRESFGKFTPLHLAVCNNGTERDNDTEIVRALIEAGADVNAVHNIIRGKLTGFNGSDLITPLHNAAAEGYAEIATMLLYAGAKKNAIDREGWTPLHWAANYGQSEVALTLLEAGADINAVRRAKQSKLEKLKIFGKKRHKIIETPLHGAVSKGHIETTRLFLIYGANPININSDNESIKRILERYRRESENEFQNYEYQTAITVLKQLYSKHSCNIESIRAEINNLSTRDTLLYWLGD